MKRYQILALLAALVLLVSACGGADSTEGGNGQTDPGQGQQQGDSSVQQTKEAGSILCRTEKATLRLIKKEDGKWLWREDESFPLDQACVQQLLDQVAGLTQLVPLEQPDELKEYDLDEPDLYLTVTQPDGSSVTYYLGNDVESGGNYMYQDGVPEKIYVVPAVWKQLISRSIYDMAVLPQLPQIDAAQVKSMEVTGAEGTVPNVLSAKVEEGTVAWKVTGAVELEKTVHLAETLQTLAVDRCVDYAPSSGAAAVCGLDQPRSVVTVTYTNSVGTESVLTLRLGDACSGGYYVLVNEDTTIYRLPQTTADMLLALAPEKTEAQ